MLPDDTVPSGPASPSPSGGHHPARIDAYRIVRILGQGGMGLVYEAEQLLAVLYEGWGKGDRAAEYRRRAEER